MLYRPRKPALYSLDTDNYWYRHKHKHVAVCMLSKRAYVIALCTGHKITNSISSTSQIWRKKKSLQRFQTRFQTSNEVPITLVWWQTSHLLMGFHYHGHAFPGDLGQHLQGVHSLLPHSWVWRCDFPNQVMGHVVEGLLLGRHDLLSPLLVLQGRRTPHQKLLQGGLGHGDCPIGNLQARDSLARKGAMLPTAPTSPAHTTPNKRCHWGRTALTPANVSSLLH